MSNNVNYTVEGQELVIRIDVSAQSAAQATLSSTGKTKLLATTNGPVPVEVGAHVYKLSLNLMVPVAR